METPDNRQQESNRTGEGSSSRTNRSRRQGRRPSGGAAQSEGTSLETGKGERKRVVKRHGGQQPAGQQRRNSEGQNFKKVSQITAHNITGNRANKSLQKELGVEGAPSRGSRIPASGQRVAQDRAERTENVKQGGQRRRVRRKPVASKEEQKGSSNEGHPEVKVSEIEGKEKVNGRQNNQKEGDTPQNRRRRKPVSKERDGQKPQAQGEDTREQKGRPGGRNTRPVSRYKYMKIELDDDYEGKTEATLICRRAPRNASRAVLYIPGFSDYFFQDYIAQWYIRKGFNFYALELRKYGRSIMDHQKPNNVRELKEYFEEMEQAIHLIKNVENNRQLLLHAHSMGALVTMLYGDFVSGTGNVNGYVLNSPFLDFNVSGFQRMLVPLIARMGKLMPNMKAPVKLPEVYGQSLHRSAKGKHNFDLKYKPLEGNPITMGWVHAVKNGHDKIHQGLQIEAPILVMHSDKSMRLSGWDKQALHCDTVLDVNQIKRWAPKLGHHVEMVEIKNGMHDLFLSDRDVQVEVFAALDRWINETF